MAQPKKPFVLRISPELLEAIEQWANEEFRSVNGQMEYLLTQAVRKRRGVTIKVNHMEKTTNELKLLPLEPNTSSLIFLKKKLLNHSFEGSDESGNLLMYFTRTSRWSRNAQGFWFNGEAQFRFPKWYSPRIEINIVGVSQAAMVERKLFWRSDHLHWFNHRFTFVQKGFFLRHFQLIDQNQQVVLDWHITERFLSFRLECANDGRIYKLPHPEALILLCLFLILQRLRDAQSS